ncbi:MAG: four helix bundle protein, partial [Patescibacteria group bacterium]
NSIDLYGFKKFSTPFHSPPQRVLPILQKLKNIYLLWYEYYQALPKLHRHSLGQRIDDLFVEIIECVAAAAFLTKEEKHPYIRLAIRKLDTLNILLMVLWETKSLDTKKYTALALKANEVGKMLGGWNGQLLKSLEQARDKQNSPKKEGEK